MKWFIFVVLFFVSSFCLQFSSLIYSVLRFLNKSSVESSSFYVICTIVFILPKPLQMGYLLSLYKLQSFYMVFMCCKTSHRIQLLESKYHHFQIFIQFFLIIIINLSILNHPLYFMLWFVIWCRHPWHRTPDLKKSKHLSSYIL